MMTDTRNAKAWPRVFADRRGLASALASIWEGTQPLGMTGGNLRDLYADFLAEAAELLGVPDLRECAGRFRVEDRSWREVADVALPDSVPEFVRLKELTAEVRASVADPSASSLREVEEASAELWALRRRLDQEFPLGDSAVADLFTRIGEAVGSTYERATEALEHLRRGTA
jgi:hypothetical protein